MHLQQYDLRVEEEPSLRGEDCPINILYQLYNVTDAAVIDTCTENADVDISNFNEMPDHVFTIMPVPAADVTIGSVTITNGGKITATTGQTTDDIVEWQCVIDLDDVRSLRQLAMICDKHVGEEYLYTLIVDATNSDFSTAVTVISDGEISSMSKELWRFLTWKGYLYMRITITLAQWTSTNAQTVFHIPNSGKNFVELELDFKNKFEIVKFLGAGASALAGGFSSKPLEQQISGLINSSGPFSQVLTSLGVTATQLASELGAFTAYGFIEGLVDATTLVPKLKRVFSGLQGALMLGAAGIQTFAAASINSVSLGSDIAQGLIAGGASGARALVILAAIEQQRYYVRP